MSDIIGARLKVHINIGEFETSAPNELWVLQAILRRLASRKTHLVLSECFASFKIMGVVRPDPKTWEPVLDVSMNCWKLREELLVHASDLVDLVSSETSRFSYAAQLGPILRTWAKASWTT